MAERIDITRTQQGIYDVQVVDGAQTTTHRVDASREVVAAVASGATIDEIDLEEKVVRVSFEYLLEREPADEILDEFALNDISKYFPSYQKDIVSRVNA